LAKVRFQADDDLYRTIIHGPIRRPHSVDFRLDPLNAIDDDSVLRIAALDGRVLVSHDFHTMPAAFARYRRTEHSPGVLLIPQLWPIANSIEHLALIWELTEASEWQDRICYLPTFADFRVDR
jgi:hypothetical protein